MNDPKWPVSAESLVKVAAYCHYYNIPFLPGRLMSATHLRRLSHWIDQPDNQLRSLRQHPQLAAHLVLLQATRLLQHNEQHWFCGPDLNGWLQAAPVEKAQLLLTAMAACRWTAVAEKWNLPDLVCPAFMTHIQQTIRQWPRKPEVAQPVTITVTAEEAWQVELPQNLNPFTLFHLLQFGEWQPQQALRLTSLTIGRAHQNGYGLLFIEQILSTALADILPSYQRQQLLAWYRQADTYQVRSVYLLQTAQTEQLAAILENGRLRRRVQEQLSPRHAVISPDMIPALQRWLTKQNRRLKAPVPAEKEGALAATEFHWLGLRLMVGLGELIPLPLPPPHSLLEETASYLTPSRQADCEAIAQQLLQNLRQAIHGRDAFFPTKEPTNPDWIRQIEKAIAAERPLTISYQALGDLKPSCRQIQPLRLEDRQPLIYLHAYCYRAEMNLTFRLDRVTEIRNERC